jgi:glycerophosphoryl diester phosphodiesterase
MIRGVAPSMNRPLRSLDERAPRSAPDGAARFEGTSSTRRVGFNAPAMPTTASSSVDARPIDANDFHIAPLDEVNRRLLLRPENLDKEIYLDTKTPTTEPEGREVAKRMAQQLVAQLKTYTPEEQKSLVDRWTIMNPNSAHIAEMRAVFENSGVDALRGFNRFTWDNESLNGRASGRKSTLSEAGNNDVVSLGNPVAPRGVVSAHGFEDLVQEVRDTRRAIDAEQREPKRKLVAWTVSNPAKIRALVNAGVDGILTDDPALMRRTLDAMRPRPNVEVIAHRGGPNSDRNPENTLPRIAEGLRTGDAVEIDICSAKDGLLTYHDNNADMTTTLRNMGMEMDRDMAQTNAWHPTRPDVTSSARGKRIDQLTMAEVQKNFGFERQVTSSPVTNALQFGAKTILDAPATGLRALENATGFKPFGWLADGFDWTRKNLVQPVVDTVFKIAAPVVDVVAKGIETIGDGVRKGVKAIGKFFSSIF